VTILLTANSTFNITNFRLGLVRALRQHGQDVSILAPVDSNVDALTEIGCTVRHLEMDNTGTSPINDFKLIRRFAREFRKQRPDLVLSFTIKNNIFGALAARRSGTPFIPTITGLGTAFLSGRALRWMACRLYAQAFRHLPTVVFQNTEDRDMFLELGLVTHRQSHMVTGSGVDTEHFAPVAFPAGGSSRTFVMIARMLRDKGVEEFVEAARLCRAKRPGLDFCLVGPADSRNRSAIGLEQLTVWDAEGAVRYLGERIDVRPDIAKAHCVVLPSYREGLPRVLLEAAAMARPVVATDVPGCRDIVEDGANGYLCVPRDAADLAEKMMDMAALPLDRLSEMGSTGRDKVLREFSERGVIDEYLALIEGGLRGSRLDRSERDSANVPS